MYPEIEELNTYLEKVLSGDDPPEILDIEEGELSILKSNIYKVTTKLKYQKELLRQDKVTLATAMADISHQLKTPLTSMMVMNDLLKREEDRDKREEFLKTQSDQLDRMNWLIQTLLKLSKLDAGSVVLTKEDVPADDLIKEVMKPFEIQLDIKDISFERKIPDAFVMCDKNWTVEAIQNIVKNCIEHMDKGGSLKVSLTDTSIFSQIQISDTGCGIATEDIPHVFERFYRGKNAGKDSVGIGLAISTDPTITGIRVPGDKEERFRIGNVMHGDADLFSQLVVDDHEGRLPETSNEVAVEEAFLEDNGFDLKIGDKITFEQGNRYEIEPDGNRIYYAGSYRSEEQFETLSTDTCTITAILHENRPTKGYDILRGMEKGTPVGLDDKGRPYLHCRVTLRNPDYTSVLQLRQIEEDHKLHIDDINSEFMISVFAIKGMGEAYIQFFMMTGIALLIVVATSVVLIYNAFGMSLAEKIRYLGMLASVGATKSQKRASIYYEGLVLGIVGIPLGILTGILGAAVTLNVLGSRLLETEVIVGAEGMRGGIPIVVSPLVILAIVILSSITIFISALIPAIKASNVMPVDAMRQTNIVKVRAGKLKTNPFIKNIFGYEGVLACKNIKRNGVKGTVIVISLAISVKQLCNLMCQPD